MTVERYRDVSEMPPPARPPRDQLLKVIAAVWERAHVRAPTPLFRGVFKYRSLDEARKDREARTAAHLRALRRLGP